MNELYAISFLLRYKTIAALSFSYANINEIIAKEIHELGLCDRSLVHPRIPNNHVSRPPPIFIKKSIEARPHAS